MVEYFKWGAPQALKWLWLLLPVAALLWRAIVRRLAASRALVPVEADRRLALRPLRERLILKALLTLAATGLLVVAMARPQVGLHREKATRKGADILLVLDTSLSMLARDLTPSRLEAARRVGVSLVNRLPDDRFGVIVFAGKAYLYCPLTVDHDAVQMFIESVQAGASPTPGTALNSAVKLAAETLAESESRHRAMVILSDGEDHESDTLQVAEKAVRQTGVRIEVLGFGTLEGEPIPVLDESGNVIGLKKDASGQTVLSKLGEEELKKLAATGKGSYRRVSERGATEELASRLEAMEGSQVGTTIYTEYGERFQWPLIVAIVLLMLEAVLVERRRPRRPAKESVA